MDNFGEQHCRLCLSTISDEHFKEMDVTKSILDVLILKLNLDNTNKYIMCNVCSRRVMEAFRFKSMCVNTDNIIIPYVDDETGCSIDLKEIYVKETEKNHLIPTLEDYQVCRFCMQLVKDEFILAHEMAADMIEMYIPKINLSLVEDPIICKQCFDSFVSHSNFIKNCLEVNKKIKSFCDTEVVDDSMWTPTADSFIKTEEVDIKSENEQEDEWLEADLATLRSVYEGISNKINHSEIKTEDEDVKSEAVHVTDSASADSVTQGNSSKDNKYSATDHASTLSCHLTSHKGTHNVCVFQYDAGDCCEQKHSLKEDPLRHKHISGTEGFRCDACVFGTKQNADLKRQESFSKTKVFECSTCDYKTKYKGSLRIHLQKHKDISETEVFECDTCGHKTKQKRSLRVHQLTHKDISETEVFVCHTCGYKTKYKGGLKIHLLTHKDISEWEVFECDRCDYKTKHRSNLKQHQLAHKDCNRCRSALSNRGSTSPI